MRETGAIAPNDAEGEKTMRKYEVVVPENVEMADIQAIQKRVRRHDLLTVALLIPLFAGYALRESSEALGDIVFVLSLALMVLGFISGRGDEKRLPAYWAKYQQIHRMDNLPQTNLVGVWLSNETRIAITRDGEAYRVQESISNSRNGAWMTDEQGKTFSKIGDVREYLAQAGFKAGKADFGQMTDEEFQQFLDAHRI